jgi:hypothetical protein
MKLFWLSRQRKPSGVKYTEDSTISPTSPKHRVTKQVAHLLLSLHFWFSPRGPAVGVSVPVFLFHIQYYRFQFAPPCYIMSLSICVLVSYSTKQKGFNTYIEPGKRCGTCCGAGAEEPKWNRLLEPEPKLRIVAPALAPAPAAFYLSKNWRNFYKKIMVAEEVFVNYYGTILILFGYNMHQSM